MVLWTILPETMIFSERSDFSPSNIQPEPALEEIEYNGCKILAQAASENQYQIVRLITTNPNDYLNNQLTPGKIISCKKNFEILE